MDLINRSLESNRFWRINTPVISLCRQIFKKNLLITSVAFVFWKSSQTIIELRCGKFSRVGISWWRNTGILQSCTIFEYAFWDSVKYICTSVGSNANACWWFINISVNKVVLPAPELLQFLKKKIRFMCIKILEWIMPHKPQGICNIRDWYVRCISPP